MMNVRDLKEFVGSIDSKLDNSELVFEGYGGGFNPIHSVTVNKKLVTPTSPKSEEDKSDKYVALLSVG